MALSVKVVNFTPANALVGTTQAITGVGFQPKAIIFFFGGSASVVDQDISADAQYGLGFAVSSTKRGATGSCIEDALATTSANVAFRSDCCIFHEAIGGTVTDGRWDFVSMDVDGFTLIVDEDPVNSPRRVTAICYGGSDITDVDFGSFSSPTATGNQDVGGLSFQPDIVFFAGTGQAGPLPDDDAAARCCFGVGKSAAQQGVLWGYSEDAAANSITRKYAAIDSCLMMRLNTGVGVRAQFVQQNANGFRVNWTHVDGATSVPIIFLAIKGGSWLVGDAATATSITTVVETGFGFTPKAVLVASHGLDTWNTALVESNGLARILGAADGSTEVGHHTFEANNLATSNVWIGIQYDELITTHSDSAILGQMGRQSLDADGITFNQTDADTLNRLFWYVACGDAVVGGGYEANLSLLGVGA